MYANELSNFQLLAIIAIANRPIQDTTKSSEEESAKTHESK